MTAICTLWQDVGTVPSGRHCAVRRALVPSPPLDGSNFALPSTDPWVFARHGSPLRSRVTHPVERWSVSAIPPAGFQFRTRSRDVNSRVLKNRANSSPGFQVGLSDRQFPGRLSYLRSHSFERLRTHTSRSPEPIDRKSLRPTSAIRLQNLLY